MSAAADFAAAVTARRSTRNSVTPLTWSPNATRARRRAHQSRAHHLARHGCAGPASAGLRILDMDDDVLMRIVHFVLSPVRVANAERVVERAYLAALPVAAVCRRMRRVFHASLRDVELWQSAKLPSDALGHVARTAGPDLRRIVIRNCSQVQPSALHALADHCTMLRTVDVSHVDAVDDSVVTRLVAKRGRTLRSLLIRGCKSVTDVSLRGLAAHARALDALDMAGLPAVTDAGMCAMLAARGRHLVSLVCSACPLLTDASLAAMGAACRNLEVLCARSLPAVTNEGVEALCAGVGDRLEVLDVLDCDAVTVKRFLESVAAHCPRLSGRFMDGAGRTLRQVIISSLPGFIFHVTGRDAYNGRSAVYFLLVDPGTSNSFRVSVGNEHMNLVDYGTILCSCFGDQPNEAVRDTLLSEFGLDLDDQNAS
jgi:hypothetical protein